MLNKRALEWFLAVAAPLKKSLPYSVQTQHERKQPRMLSALENHKNAREKRIEGRKKRVRLIFIMKRHRSCTSGLLKIVCIRSLWSFLLNNFATPLFLFSLAITGTFDRGPFIVLSLSLVCSFPFYSLVSARNQLMCALIFQFLLTSANLLLSRLLLLLQHSCGVIKDLAPLRRDGFEFLRCAQISRSAIAATCEDLRAAIRKRLEWLFFARHPFDCLQPG
jgi:hypothetical protein